MLGYPPNHKGREAWLKKTETSLSSAWASVVRDLPSFVGKLTVRAGTDHTGPPRQTPERAPRLYTLQSNRPDLLVR